MFFFKKKNVATYSNSEKIEKSFTWNIAMYRIAMQTLKRHGIYSSTGCMVWVEKQLGQCVYDSVPSYQGMTN